MGRSVHPILLFVTLAALAAPVVSQMEKRDLALYDKVAMASARPAVGTIAPDLTLSDIDGRPWALSSFKGRIVVLVKGGYT